MEAPPYLAKETSDLVGATGTPLAATFAADAVFLASDYELPDWARVVRVTVTSDTAGRLDLKLAGAWSALNGGASLVAGAMASFTAPVKGGETVNVRLHAGGVVSRFMLEVLAR